MNLCACKRVAGVGVAVFALFSLGAGVAETAGAVPAVDGAAIVSRLKDYQGELTDMTATMAVKHENDAALRKISPDFAQFVRFGFRTLKYSYKAPDKVRMESTAQFFHFLKGISIRNGDHKDFYVPALHVHKTEDVTGEPNKKETSLDWGLFNGDVWTNYRVWYMRSEKDPSGDVYVIGVKPDNHRLEGTMVMRVDAATLRVLERDRYNGDGILLQRELFTNYIHPLPHVWLPTDIKLYNNKGEFGGDLVYTHVLVNSGVSDSIFK